MRSILLATCIAVGATSIAFVTPVRAEVTVSVPGVAVETGRDDHRVDRRDSMRHDDVHVDRHDSMRHDDVVTDKSKSVSHDGDRTTVRKSSDTVVR